MNRNQDFKDVQHGQPVELSARRHNAVNEVLRRSAGARFDRGLVALPARTSRVPDIFVQNVSGKSLDRFAVVEITGTAIPVGTQGFTTAPVLEGNTPGVDAVAIAVLSQPIGDTRTGGAWIHGVVTLQIDVIEEDHKYVDAKDGSNQFESGDEGYVIQWKESGTGIKWAVVNLSRQSGGSGEPKLIGVTNNAVSFGGSAEVTIYSSGTPGQAPTPVTPQRIETAWFDWIAGDEPEDIEANTDVAIEIAEHGEYRIYHAACSPRSGR